MTVELTCGDGAYTCLRTPRQKEGETSLSTDLILMVITPLLGNLLQRRVLVQDAHVALSLSLCYGCHVVLAHTLVLHLQAKRTAAVAVSQDWAGMSQPFVHALRAHGNSAAAEGQQGYCCLD